MHAENYHNRITIIALIISILVVAVAHEVLEHLLMFVLMKLYELIN